MKGNLHEVLFGIEYCFIYTTLLENFDYIFLEINSGENITLICYIYLTWRSSPPSPWKGRRFFFVLFLIFSMLPKENINHKCIYISFYCMSVKMGVNYMSQLHRWAMFSTFPSIFCFHAIKGNNQVNCDQKISAG